MYSCSIRIYFEHLCLIEKEEVCQLSNELTKSKERISELEQSIKMHVNLCIVTHDLIISLRTKSSKAREDRES